MALIGVAQAKGGVGSTVIVKLGEPRFRRETHNKHTTRTVRYSARILNRATGNLSYLESDRDRASDADLSDAYLRQANLSLANISGADLSGATFCNTTMPDGSTNNSSC